jgi:hypothetical protein
MPGPSTKNSSEMKKSILAGSFLLILVIVCFSGCKRKEKQLNISVKLEITGEGYYDFDRGARKHDDYFSKVTVTNNQAKPFSFWMMSCSWWHQTLIFDTDSIEFSAGGCDKNIPLKVELKAGKSIIFYPVFRDISKKRFHPDYSDSSKNNKQVRIGFILMRNEPKDPYTDIKFVSPGNIYWSNPVSLDYRNNGYRITENN